MTSIKIQQYLTHASYAASTKNIIIADSID